MNQQAPAPPSGGLHDVRTATNVLNAFARTFSMTVEVFLRGGFGSRYLGMHAAGGIVLIPFWSVFWPREDCRPLLGFLFAYLAMCFLARLGMGWRALRGVRSHTRYNGRPRLLRLCPWMDEVRFKKQVEPVLVFTLGVLLLPLSQPLGSFLMVAAFALVVSVHMVDTYGRVRAMDMHDAFLEQRELAERFRRMRDEAFDN